MAGDVWRVDVPSPATLVALVGRTSLRGELSQLQQTLSDEGFPAGARFFFNHLEAPKVNHSKRPISEWADDLWLSVAEPGSRKGVRAAIRAMVRGRRLGERDLAGLRGFGDGVVAPLRELLVTSASEPARVCAAWAMQKLERGDPVLCAELLEQERSPALSVLLAGTLIAHGEKRGFKTLIKAARSGDQKTPISWLASKPSVGRFAQAVLAQYTGQSFRKAGGWEQWHGEYRHRLRWSPKDKRFKLR
jgi:hypothetical protein